MKNNLSKLAMGFVMTAMTVVSVQAQTDQLRALKNIPDGTEFVEYWGVEKDEMGYTGTVAKENSGEPQVFHFAHLNNVLDELGTFQLVKQMPASKSHESNYYRPNHPTKPSLFAVHYKAPVYVMLDGLIYEFKATTKEEVLKGNFKIEHIYEPKVQSETKENQNSFMVLLKTQKKSNINKPVCKSKAISDKDHYQIIKDYFAAMQPIQEEATKNFTSAEVEKFDKIKVLEQERVDKILKKAAEDRAKYIPAGNSSSNDKVSIVNNTGHSVCIVQGGTSKSIGSGTTKFSCNEAIYYGVKDGNNCTSTKGGLIISSGSCGKSITLE